MHSNEGASSSREGGMLALPNWCGTQSPVPTPKRSRHDFDRRSDRGQVASVDLELVELLREGEESVGPLGALGDGPDCFGNDDLSVHDLHRGASRLCRAILLPSAVAALSGAPRG